VLAEQDPLQRDPKVVENVLGFFRNLDRPYATQKNPKLWTKTIAAVEKLRAIPAAPQNPATPTVTTGQN
jgi:hypothetical protein